MDQFDKDFASHWDELVGWEKRSDIDLAFLLKLIEEFQCKTVLDVAAGTGFHAINLLRAGLDVTGLDVSQAMIDMAKENAARHGVDLTTVCAHWTSIKDTITEKFDCVICLGNSLACENDADKRQTAVYNWTKVLTDDGIVIVDRRNYEALLKNEYVLEAKKQYCGESVTINPDKVTNDDTIFSYTFADGKKFSLQMYPILDEHIKKLFANAGFSPVKVYGDHELNFNERTVGFYHYVFKRSKNAHV